MDSITSNEIPDVCQQCGLIAIVGRPNVGKSTLLNALVGQKVSITSKKAQTTRHRIIGVRTLGECQFVFIDTPGFQTKHNAALNRTLNKAVQGAIVDVDLILFVVEAGRFTLEDAKVLNLLSTHIPIILVANKLDQVHKRSELVPWLKSMQERYDFAQYVPMAARSAKDVEKLLKICIPYLPQQAWWYDKEMLTDKNERFLTAEMIREKVFRFTGDELPYTCTVVVDAFKEEGSGTRRSVRIAASIIVDRDAHKAMIIGQAGASIKRIGVEARQDLEQLLGAKVHLDLWVKVRSGWADNEAGLRAYGY